MEFLAHNNFEGELMFESVEEHLKGGSQDVEWAQGGTIRGSVERIGDIQLLESRNLAIVWHRAGIK